LSAALLAAGVDTQFFKLIDDATTGAAIVELTPDGEGYITLALSGATELTADDVAEAMDATAAEVIVVQLDLSCEPVAEVLSHRRAPIVIGNLVTDSTLDRSMLRQLDVLVVNQPEAATILGADVEDPVEASALLQLLGPVCTVVTAGARGAAFSFPGGS